MHQTKLRLGGSPQKKSRREIAQSTLETLDRGAFSVASLDYDIAGAIAHSVSQTKLYSSQSELADWKRDATGGKVGKSSVQQVSTLAAARLLVDEIDKEVQSSETSSSDQKAKIGLLNFASAKNPGGGFLSGASAQEESLARSSSLYRSQLCPTAQKFYSLHKSDPQGGFYSHSMVYSPDVVLIRNDDGTFHSPQLVDVLTSPAVNVSAMAAKHKKDGKGETPDADKIERVMRERAARALYAFELNGVRNIVLGAWGCGVFGNDVQMIANIFADLLEKSDGRFIASFDRVIFAVLGQKEYSTFKETYDSRQ